ncbi:MAG: FG-GAP repeat protein [Myxococcales bacterium]|nr:FG-GAP repeat protein [Myxococcales bacterium]
MTCPAGEVLTAAGCALDCPPGTTTGCRDTGVPVDAALEAGDARPSPDVVDVVDAPDAQDVGVACDGGAMACSGRCVSTQTDTMNCGACGNACPTSAGSVASCVMGMCRATCVAGYEMVGSACEMIAPRPVFPPGTSTVTNLRPTLKWALPMGVDGAEVELCRDRACTMMIERVTATGATARPMADLPRSSVVFWRVRGRVGAATGTRTSPTWQFRTRATSTTVDTAYGTELDVNGDGFTDLAVGALLGGSPRAGAIHVHHGSATGLSLRPVVTIERLVMDGSYPWRLAAAGDVNGDGFGDLLAASQFDSPMARSGAGRVELYFGGASGVSGTPAVVLAGEAAGDGFGVSVRGAGDVNGDGFGDVVVGALNGDVAGAPDVGSVSLFLGRANGLASSPSQKLGYAYNVSSAGDVNGDGLADLVVGNPRAPAASMLNAGAAFVLHGSSSGVNTTPSRVLQGARDGDGFGVVSGAGDMDGDGFSDVAVAAPDADPDGRMDAGTVSVFRGTSGGVAMLASVTMSGPTAGDRLGLEVVGVGDTNNDGYSDLAMGGPSGDLPGRVDVGLVFVLSGAATLSPAGRQLAGTMSGLSFGRSVAGGDYNGDGFGDVAVGEFRAFMSRGQTLIFDGSSSGTSAVAAAALVGSRDADQTGYSLAVAHPLRSMRRSASTQSGSSIFHTPSSRTSCIVKRLPTP